MVLDPWGNTAYGALRWSYGLLTKSQSPPNIFAEFGKGTKVRTEMTMLDHRAQGAMIRSIVHRYVRERDPVADSMLVAYFLPKPVKERVPGGGLEIVDRFHGDRRPAIYEVAWWLLGQHGTGAHTIRGMMEIVTQWTTQRGGARRLARLMRMRMERVLAARAEAYHLLEQKRDEGLNHATAALMLAGLVEPARAEEVA